MNLLLNKNQIADMIKNHDKSIKFHKPKKSLKSSAVWESFSIVVVNDVQQEIACCDECKMLLIYRQKDGTNSLAKHKRSCQCGEINSTTSSINQTKVTEFYSSSKTYNIPKKIKEKVKMACTEFIALDSRAFELVSGEGFLQMAQSIFDAGKQFNPTSCVNVKEFIPSPITVNTQRLI